MNSPSHPDIALKPSRWSSDPALRGMALVLIAAIGWSFMGLFTRMMTVDIWTAVALRSLIGGIFLFLFLLIRDRIAVFRNLVTIGSAGWLVVLLSVAAQGTTTASFFLTSVAHTAVIYATCPFFAAIIARFWLKEKIPLATGIAILASLIGIVLVVSGSSGPSSLLGDTVAFFMMLTFAIIIVLAKAHPGLKLAEITAVSAFLVCLIFLPFAGMTNLDVRNLTILSVYGFVSVVFSFLLFLRGAQHIPAATSGLILTLDIVLSPYWVWLFFDEAIDLPTFIGGAIVAVAVTVHLILSLRTSKPSIGA